MRTISINDKTYRYTCKKCKKSDGIGLFHIAEYIDAGETTVICTKCSTTNVLKVIDYKYY